MSLWDETEEDNEDIQFFKKLGVSNDVSKSKGKNLFDDDEESDGGIDYKKLYEIELKKRGAQEMEIQSLKKEIVRLRDMLTNNGIEIPQSTEDRWKEMKYLQKEKRNFQRSSRSKLRSSTKPTSVTVSKEKLSSESETNTETKKHVGNYLDDSEDEDRESIGTHFSKTIRISESPEPISSWETLAKEEKERKDKLRKQMQASARRRAPLSRRPLNANSVPGASIPQSKTVTETKPISVMTANSTGEDINGSSSDSSWDQDSEDNSSFCPPVTPLPNAPSHQIGSEAQPTSDSDDISDKEVELRVIEWARNKSIIEMIWSLGQIYDGPLPTDLDSFWYDCHPPMHIDPMDTRKAYL